MTKNTTSGGIQRRTVVAGAAWTIPVVATAVGAPLAAASTTPPQPPQYSVAFTGATSLTPAIVTRNSAFDATAAIQVTGPDVAEWVEVEVWIQSVANNPQGPVLRGGPVAPYGFTLTSGSQKPTPLGFVDAYVYRAYSVPPTTFNFTFRSFVNAASPNGLIVAQFFLRAPAGHGGGNVYSPANPIV